MKKKLLPILVLYALAAILSLGGAIGASAFTPEWASEAQQRALSNALFSHYGSPPFIWNNWIAECEPDWVLAFDVNRDNDKRPCTYRYGFPFRCVFSVAEVLEYDGRGITFRREWFTTKHLWIATPGDALSLSPPQDRPGALAFAIGILPLGLLANTITLGTGMFLTIAATRALIARRRRRAGRCTNCGYQLIGLASTMPCPECGQHAPRSVAT